MNTWNQYHSPNSIQEALTLLQQYDQDAQIVAGGTDLILDLEFGNHAAVEALVDVTAIPNMDRIIEEDGWIELGAAATHAQIERSPLVQEHGTALAESSSVVGGHQVRNVDTIGGNDAHAQPAADGTIGLMALDAQVQISTQ
jgi:xanthine dehydrogenase FAD-binding subunit